MRDHSKIALAGSVLFTFSSMAEANDCNTEVQTVLQSEDWKTIKTIWRLVNKIEPSDDDFNHPMSTEKGESLNRAMVRLFSDMSWESPQMKTAFSLVRNITTSRVIRLSTMNELMLTRMVPPWTEMVQDNLLFDFEKRITALTNLVDAGTISTQEFIAARDSLLTKAEKIALIDILNNGSSYGPFYQLDYGIMDTEIEEIIERLDMSYRAALDSLNSRHNRPDEEYYLQVVEQHEIFSKRYEDFNLAKPVLRILLTDLMEAGV